MQVVTLTTNFNNIKSIKVSSFFQLWVESIMQLEVSYGYKRNPLFMDEGGLGCSAGINTWSDLISFIY